MLSIVTDESKNVSHTVDGNFKSDIGKEKLLLLPTYNFWYELISGEIWYVKPDISAKERVSKDWLLFDKSVWIGSSEQFKTKNKILDKPIIDIDLVKYIK